MKVPRKNRENTEAQVVELQQQVKTLEAQVAELIASELKYKQAIKRLKAQNEVAHILAESTSLKFASSKILQAIGEILQLEWGALWGLDRQSSTLHCLEMWHGPFSEATDFENGIRHFTFTPGVGLPGRLLLTGKPSCISEIEKDDNFPRASMAVKAGLHSAIAFPIIIGEEVLGVIEFLSREVVQPDDELITMMMDICNQIGEFNWQHYHGDNFPSSWNTEDRGYNF